MSKKSILKSKTNDIDNEKDIINEKEELKIELKEELKEEKDNKIDLVEHLKSLDQIKKHIELNGFSSLKVYIYDILNHAIVNTNQLLFEYMIDYLKLDQDGFPSLPNTLSDYKTSSFLSSSTSDEDDYDYDVESNKKSEIRANANATLKMSEKRKQKLRNLLN